MNNKQSFAALVVAIAMVFSVGCKSKPAKTIEDLKAAITGETVASQKYAAFAQKARDEKFDAIAKLFEAASKAEAIHAKKHTDALDKLNVKMDAVTPQFTIKTTKENLEDAIKGESHEVDTMYPDFVKAAQGEKQDEAVASFDTAMKVEKVHLSFYKEALEALNKNDMKVLSDTYAVCPKCGNTFGKNVPDMCEICGVAKAEFNIIK